MRLQFLVLPLAAATVAAPFLANPAHASPGDTGPIVLTRDQVPTAADETISNIIFLNRCVGGCTIYPGSRNDARTNTSTIVNTQVSITEFAFDQTTWDQIVQCVTELYAPYDVVVTDVDPGPDIFHGEAIVAGSATEINRPGVWGIAPGGVGCAPINNAITFNFANDIGPSPLTICSVIGQETAHAYGLDHVLSCKTPMTYLGATCGRQWFRNENLPCGEFEPRGCECSGPNQNDHVILRAVFGDGTPPPPPTLSLGAPTNGTEVLPGFTTIATATDPRQVYEVDFYVNGWKYETKPGHDYVDRNNPYVFAAPSNLPQGVQNIEVRARNDLGSESVATVQVTMGPPCTSEATCLQGQTCNGGACTWPAPDRNMGDTCEINQECTTELCASDGTNSICTETCFTGINDFCPDGFTCLQAGAPGEGVCWPDAGAGDDPGCCSAGDTSSQRGQLLLALLVGLLLWRRRRRCAISAT